MGLGKFIQVYIASTWHGSSKSALVWRGDNNAFSDNQWSPWQSSNPGTYTVVVSCACMRLIP